MKKIIIASLASAIILSTGITTNQADAVAKKSIYLNKTTANKILSGKYSFGGIKLGSKFSSYNKNYTFSNSYLSIGHENQFKKKYADTVSYNPNTTLGRVSGKSDLQENMLFTKKIVNRVQLWVDDKNTTTPKQMQKYYGKPKYTAKSGAGCCFVRAEIYNTATMYYYIPFTKSQTMKLAAIDMYKYKNTTEMKKFARYLNKKGVDISYTITKAKWK